MSELRGHAPAALAALLMVLFGVPAESQVEVCLTGTSQNDYVMTQTVEDGPFYPSDSIGFAEGGSPCESIYNHCGEAKGNFVAYGWSVSRSVYDPDVNVADLPEGMTGLYLWNRCGFYDMLELGWSSAFFDISVTGAEYVDLYVAYPFSNVGTKTSPVIVSDYSYNYPVEVVGLIILQVPPTAVEGESWGGIKSKYR